MGLEKHSLIRQHKKNTNTNSTTNKTNYINEYAKNPIYNTIFSTRKDRLEISRRAAIMETRNHEFRYIPKNVQTPRQARIRTHRNKKEKGPPPCSLSTPHS